MKELFDQIIAISHAFFVAHPYTALFIMITVEEVGVFLPFPGDAALLLFGVWSQDNKVEFIPTLLIVCAATLVGATSLYYISRWLGTLLLERYPHWLRYMHITQDNIDMIERWMAKYGWATLVIARLTPGLRIVGTVAAGMLGVPLRVFLPATMVGTVLWTSIYYFAGSVLGRRYANQVDALLSNRWLVLEVMIVGIVVWLIIAKYGVPAFRRRMSKST
jgi:membrane protein DedA with SNARE-associated domain